MLGKDAEILGQFSQALWPIIMREEATWLVEVMFWMQTGSSGRGCNLLDEQKLRPWEPTTVMLTLPLCPSLARQPGDPWRTPELCAWSILIHERGKRKLPHRERTSAQYWCPRLPKDSTVCSTNGGWRGWVKKITHIRNDVAASAQFSLSILNSFLHFHYGKEVRREMQYLLFSCC